MIILKKILPQLYNIWKTLHVSVSKNLIPIPYPKKVHFFTLGFIWIFPPLVCRHKHYIKKCVNVSHLVCSHLFVAASHQTQLDTRSKARRPIKVGIKGRGGRELAETRTLLVSAAHRLT